MYLYLFVMAFNEQDLFSQNIPPMPAPPPVQPPTTDYIHKKVAAQEVINRLIITRLVSIIGIAVAFIGPIAMIFGYPAAMIVIVASCAGFGYYLFTTDREIKRLSALYQIK